jgi:hypothetical protein
MGTWLGIAAGVIVVALMTVASRSRTQSRAEAAASSGAAFTVYAGIRRQGAGWWRGRWRHGLVTVNGRAIAWRPKWPRPGPPISLSDVLFGRPRPAKGLEAWWVNSEAKIYTIYSFHDPSVRYDLALLPESEELVVGGGKSSGA